MALFLYNRVTAQKAGVYAADVAAQLEEIAGEEGDGIPNPYDTEMTEVELDGRVYIGRLVIPTLGLVLPVQSSWSYSNLRISPCRYMGSVRSSDLVICAHNYDTHFGTIKNLQAGDDVYLTDMDGIVWHYVVCEVIELDSYDIAEMTDSDYDLTLFTCTYGGQARVTVRCMKAE